MILDSKHYDKVIPLVNNDKDDNMSASGQKEQQMMDDGDPTMRSQAVHAASDEDFEKGTYSLKRTRSMGLLEGSSTPGPDLVGSMKDYPHLTRQQSQHEEYSEEDEDGSSSAPETPDLVPANDDTAVKHEPSRHVDYLSHNWKESDISASWRYIVLRRKDVANAARLENASWRTWTKAKYNLKTVAPESVNWLKDYDVTWLYGPLYDEPCQSYIMNNGGSASPTLYNPEEHQKTDTSSVAANTASTKPILKKKSVSQMMLSRPPLESRHSDDNNHMQMYLRHHNYRHRPRIDAPSTENISDSINRQYLSNPRHQAPASSSSISSLSVTNNNNNDTSSVSTSHKPERHIHFNDRVEQCRAVEYEDPPDDEPLHQEHTTDYDDTNHNHSTSIYDNYDDDEDEDGDEDDDDDDEDEAGLFLMVKSPSSLAANKYKAPTTGTPIIEPLPATTLKYEYDENEREARRTEEATSVAYAMSHNTANRRHNYKTYDYSSVYQSPSHSPQSSPRQTSYESLSEDTPVFQASSKSATPQTTTANAVGHVDNHLPPVTSVLMGQTELVEDGSSVQEENTHEPTVTEHHRSRSLGKLNDAVNAAKGMAHSVWPGSWKRSH